MNKKGFAPIISLLIIGILAVAGGAYYFVNKSSPSNLVSDKVGANPNDSRLPLKLEDVQSVSNAQMLSLDLSSYQKEKGFYPKTLDDFFADTSYVNRGIIVGKNQISVFIKDMNYLVSNNLQGFVLYTNLKLTKDEDGNINGQPLNKINGTIFGVDCSSQKTVCFTEASYGAKENTTTQANPAGPDVPSSISLRINAGSLGLEPMLGPEVVVSWQYSGKSILNGFTVERKTSGGSYGSIAEKYFSSSYYDKTAEEGLTYLYRVKANYSASESSSYSEEASITIPASGTVISQNSVLTTNNSATISFLTSGDTRGAIQYQYDGSRYRDVQEASGSYGTNHKITVSNLSGKTNYKYWIIATNKEGVVRTTAYLDFTTK